MIYLITVIAWIIFIAMSYTAMIGLGVYDDCIQNAFCYMFAHASWLHIVINTLSMLLLWFPIGRLYILRYNASTHALQMATYFAAVFAGMLCSSHIPTVGMSGCVFFLLGVLLLLNPTKRQALNYLWLVAACAIQWYFGKSNIALHLVAFAEGVLFMCIREFIYQYTHNTGLFEPYEHADS